MKILYIFLILTLYLLHLPNSVGAVENELQIKIIQVEKQQSLIDYLLRRSLVSVDLEFSNQSKKDLWFCSHGFNFLRPVIMDNPSKRIPGSTSSWTNVQPSFLQEVLADDQIVINFDVKPLSNGKQRTEDYGLFKLLPSGGVAKLGFKIQFPVKTLEALSSHNSKPSNLESLSLSSLKSIGVTIRYYDFPFYKNTNCCKRMSDSELYVNRFWVRDNEKSGKIIKYLLPETLMTDIKERKLSFVYSKAEIEQLQKYVFESRN